MILVPASSVLFSCAREPHKGATPALFNTKAEAEKAAKAFNCSGAHKMGEKWMPCKSHKTHQGDTKHSGNGINHHNH
ncbi:hypothetical protein [Prochlorococcus marinus]|uniref:hypothetical protein n=1 Tax=Prochlorococcus marinus TaxID=1219 RepID=UPI000B34A54F|nr:hypothetical protein [Prochlorococcus marinus]